MRAFIRAHRRRARPSPYSLYMLILVCALVGAFGHGVVTTLLAGGIGPHGLLVFGPAVLLLVALAALRFGTWQGPVSFSAADVGLLLTAPIATAELIRPKLDLAIVTGACVGAVVGALMVLLISGGPVGLGPARSLCAVAGFAGVGAGATASSWIVQSARRSGRWVARGSPLVVAIAGALVAVGASVSGAVGVWSGPWGWALAPLAGTAGWALATALLLVCSGSLVMWARACVRAASIETFQVRAGTRSALAASAFTLDYRGAALAYRAARPGERIAFARIPLPASARAAIAWRDVTGLVRDPARVGWAALVAAAATLLALSHPGNVAIAGVVAGAAYLAATLLCEPLRIDVDDPDRSAVLLSLPFWRVLLAHCAVPVVVLWAIATATIAAAVAAGVAGVGALLLIATVVAPLAAVTVLAAALASRRGGRIDEDLLTRLLMTDPSNPASAAIAVLALVPWLILTLVTVGAPVALLGHAVAADRPVIGAGIAAVAIAAAATAALSRVARHTRIGT
ncbi:MAG TPA: hypothetical protein VFW09_02500 [Solirubrobacteraceae bacterium]|nr:hypothetical protein [Solirubrobacteraceae bacterium]